MSAELYSRTGLESSYASFELGTKKDGVVSRAKGPSIVAAAKRLCFRLSIPPVVGACCRHHICSEHGSSEETRLVMVSSIERFHDITSHQRLVQAVDDSFETAGTKSPFDRGSPIEGPRVVSPRVSL